VIRERDAAAMDAGIRHVEEITSVTHQDHLHHLPRLAKVGGGGAGGGGFPKGFGPGKNDHEAGPSKPPPKEDPTPHYQHAAMAAPQPQIVNYEDNYIGPLCFGPRIRAVEYPVGFRLDKTFKTYDGSEKPSTWLQDYFRGSESCTRYGRCCSSIPPSHAQRNSKAVAQ
jgi:hypothetical protein